MYPLPWFEYHLMGGLGKIVLLVGLSNQIQWHLMLRCDLVIIFEYVSQDAFELSLDCSSIYFLAYIDVAMLIFVCLKLPEPSVEANNLAFPSLASPIKSNGI